MVSSSSSMTFENTREREREREREELVVGLQRLKAEVLPWHQKVSTLRSLAEKLIDGYSSDDSSRVRATVGRLDHRWTTLLHRSVCIFHPFHPACLLHVGAIV